jgi:uncharacterized alkaline shock family protein YloU
MPEVAWSVQERVKRDVERYTGLNVDAVNVHVMRVIESEDAGNIEIGKLINPEEYL